MHGVSAVADAKQVGEGYYLVKGTARELADGRVYVVTENGYAEDMREIVKCKDCFIRFLCPLYDRAERAYGFCAWGERL